jgi:protein gp37
MSEHSSIEWTDATWNPLVGCSRVSQGCTNCYAERHAYRFARQRGSVYEGTAKLVNGKPTFTGRVNLNERALDAPLRWARPRRIFVNSMSDLFHENVTDETIDRIFAVMALAPHHTFQVLTKRPDRMRRWFAETFLTGEAREFKTENRHRQVLDEAERIALGPIGDSDRLWTADGRHLSHVQPWPLPNVWLGVSVENQEAADERIPLLRRTPAAVRFLSCEPLLGPINIRPWLVCEDCECDESPLDDVAVNACGYPRVDWVIAGGESGPSARPMHPDWVRSLRDQCAAANVPFFFKQWGEWVDQADVPGEWYDHYDVLGRTEPGVVRVGKKKAGRVLDGREHNAYPEAA